MMRQRPPGVLPDQAGQLRTAQTGEELLGLETLEGSHGQHFSLFSLPQQTQPVPGAGEGLQQLRGVLRIRQETPYGLLGFPQEGGRPGEGQPLPPQQRLVQRLPKVETVAVDELLGHRVDEVGNVPAPRRWRPGCG